MDWLVQTHYPDAAKIKLVQDNYATHTYGAFYEHLPVETARQLRHTLEFHYTPKHGSWLNRTEIEFAAEKARDKLKNRYADVTKVTNEINLSDH